MKSKNHKAAKEIITSLNSGSFYCECPCGCGNEINLSDAGLFYLDDFTEEGRIAKEQLESELGEIRKGLKKRKKFKSPHTQSINFGFISEKLMTALEDFPYEHNDCRSLFKPIDFIIFEGLKTTHKVDKIIFAELKTGNSKLNDSQKQIKNCITSKKLEINIL